MPIKVEFGGIGLTGDTQSEPSAVRRPESGSVRIGVIGDFRGRGTRGPVESGRALAGRRCLVIDRDNFDAVMAKLGVNLTLTLPSGADTPVALKFRELDDFHPDRILAKAEVFAALRATRQRLEDPSTFAEEAARISRPAEPSPSPPTPPPGADLAPDALLDLIVQQSTPSAESARAASPVSRTFEKFLDQITAGQTRRDDPRQAELIAGVETTISQVLREVLHHPEFQALESLWRAVHLMIRRLETGPDLTIELIDLTRAELEVDLLTAAPMETTAAFKRLVEPSVGTEGGRPWTFLVGDFTFGPARRDVALLWRLGQVARLAGAPFLAAASTRFAGCDDIAATPDPDDWGDLPADEGWSDLRKSAEARYLGLACPRLLLRAPYGPESDSIETFPFAEFPELAAHESYLWANPAFALAVLLAPTFDDSGRFDPEYLDDSLTDLPIPFERTPDGETQAKPCAEVLLSRRAADRLEQAGLMPIMSVRDQGIVRLARLASIAEPAAPLAFP